MYSINPVALLRNTFRTVQSALLPLLVGVCILALLGSVISYKSQTMKMGEDQMTQGMSGGMSEFDDLLAQLEIPNPIVQQELMQRMMQRAQSMKPASPKEQLRDQLKSMGIGLNFTALLTAVLSLYALSYYLLVALGMRKPVMGLVHALKRLVPMVSLSIMMFLRSFVWIAFLAVLMPGLAPLFFILAAISALMFVPRLSFAPMILLVEPGGLLKAVKESLHRTYGKWFGVVVGLVVTLLVLIILKKALLYLVMMISPIGILNIILTAVVAQLAIALFAVFLVELSSMIFHAPVAPSIGEYPQG